MENEYAEKLIKMSKNPIPTQQIKIEGVGSCNLYGEWDAEKLIKKLLEYDEITGS